MSKKITNSSINKVFALLPREVNGELVWLDYYFEDNSVFPPRAFTEGEYSKLLKKNKSSYLKANG